MWQECQWKISTVIYFKPLLTHCHNEDMSVSQCRTWTLWAEEDSHKCESSGRRCCFSGREVQFGTSPYCPHWSFSLSENIFLLCYSGRNNPWYFRLEPSSKQKWSIIILYGILVIIYDICMISISTKESADYNY